MSGPSTGWYHYWYRHLVTKHDKRLAQMRNSPTNVSFDDLASVCEHYFGEPRQRGSSHHVYKTSWPGDPGSTSMPITSRFALKSSFTNTVLMY